MTPTVVPLSTSPSIDTLQGEDVVIRLKAIAQPQPDSAEITRQMLHK